MANWPSSLDLPNIIAVAAGDHNDNLAGFSNFGATTVDLAAPGVNILSTYPTDLSPPPPNSPYAFLNGTSMATPHVSGVAALLWDLFPGLAPYQGAQGGGETRQIGSYQVTSLRDLILLAVDAKPAFAGKMVTDGRLNLNNAVQGNIPPIIDSIYATPTFGAPPLSVNFSATYHDPDGTVASVSWDFGDGSPADPNAITTYTYGVEGTYTATFTAIDNDGNQASANVVIYVVTLDPNEIIFVDGDRGDILESYFTQAFEAAGIAYELLVPPIGAPNNVPNPVVWNVGSDFNQPSLTSNDKAWLSAYLDNVGSLYFSSQDYIFTEGLDAFAENYLHIGIATQDVGATQAIGIDSDPVSCGMDLPLQYPFGDFSDVVQPGPGAVSTFLKPGQQPIAIRFEGAHKVLYTAFPFESVPFTRPQ